MRKVLSASTEDLRLVQALIIDMDGVLWRGSEALAGLVDFFAFLRRNAISFRLG
jgi:4-nitrophenyl phosphatase